MSPLFVLFALLSTPLQTNQLPTTTKTLPIRDQKSQLNCSDPLSVVAPATRCKGPVGRMTAYVMSSSTGSSNCPAQSVCLSAAETAACSDNLLKFVSEANRCPNSAPLRLFEYQPQSSSALTEVELQLSALWCPLRPRCVPLSCFDDFCRSKLRRQTDSMMAGQKDSKSEEAPSLSRPALIRNKVDGCDYLKCGCPVTEADLLAEGCPTPGEMLIIRVDQVNGCPTKMCVNKLPDSLEPLQPPSPSGRDASTKSDSSASGKAQDCSKQAVACPPGTRELAVPSPVQGDCPMRICLLPELLGGDKVINDGDGMQAQTTASPSSAVDAQATTESVTETAEQTTTIATPNDTKTNDSKEATMPTTESSTTTTADTDNAYTTATSRIAELFTAAAPESASSADLESSTAAPMETASTEAASSTEPSAATALPDLIRSNAN